MVNDDGSLGARNAVSCGSIEHKMGIHANCTCVMNYDDATGWLVGEEHEGPRCHVHHDERRRGSAWGCRDSARPNSPTRTPPNMRMDRRQGRALTGAAEPEEKADTLFVHPDVRRMLMEAKALTEGLRALCLWVALQVDLEAPRRPRRSARTPTI
jgi:alkylation response protein AidB-like acyl-CoA dehydrogenase